MESLSTNLDLVVVLEGGSSLQNHQVLYEAIVNLLGDNLSDEDRLTLEEFCRRFSRAASQRWKNCGRNSKQFRKNYEAWLQANVDWPSCVQIGSLTQGPREDSTIPEPSSSSSVGTMTKRSRKPFEDLSNKQKKRRSNEHIGMDPIEITHSAAVLLKESGREDIASVIEYMLKNPEATAKFNEFIKRPTRHVSFTAEKALGLL